MDFQEMMYPKTIELAEKAGSTERIESIERNGHSRGFGHLRVFELAKRTWSPKTKFELVERNRVQKGM